MCRYSDSRALSLVSAHPGHSQPGGCPGIGPSLLTLGQPWGLQALLGCRCRPWSFGMSSAHLCWTCGQSDVTRAPRHVRSFAASVLLRPLLKPLAVCLLCPTPPRPALPNFGISRLDRWHLLLPSDHFYGELLGWGDG